MKKSIVITLVLILATLSSLRAQEGYIVRNDTLTAGVKLLSPGGIKKYQEVYEEKGREIKTYTPNDISEFYMDGKTYVSMPSPVAGENKKVFLHQLVNRDSIVVYQYANEGGSHLFFSKNKGKFEEITATDNPYATYVAETYGGNSNYPVNNYQIKPTPQSIKFAEKLIYTRNKNLLSCIRYGAWIGGGVSFISKSVIPKKNTNAHLFGGLFLNVPIHTYFSIHSEISFMQEAYSYHYEGAASYTDRTFNRKSLFMPIMLRYSLNKMRGSFIPYIQAGPSVHFALKQKEKNQIIKFYEDHTIIEEPPVSDKSNSFYTGISGGAGLEYKLTSRHSVFLDIRYMHTFVTENNNVVYATLSVNF
ncbi:PorT family protein [Bacteroides sp. OttesenSCG-928-J23]|nr:PorT family protein [Bacteroides sp. OttesenSCG-928-J23]MDL2299562.1 PorT family protein [Bacteroides sp. OttesenSCG-928-E20]MDL2305025.1 PorT family protein [Bacteroides sp. OttesenSCG-928-D19]